ncbi:hypothetical protein D3C81_1969290 [compost metagenome]
MHGNHRRQPASLGQGLDKRLGKTFLLVDLAPIRGIELGTQGAHAFTNGIEFFIVVLHIYRSQGAWK